jgi:hypothetical protein
MVEEINFYLGKRRTCATLNDKEFELGKVHEITLPSQDWEIKIAYKNNSEYHKSPMGPKGLEGFISRIGKEVGRVEYDFDLNESTTDKQTCRSTGVIIELNKKYNFKFEHSN